MAETQKLALVIPVYNEEPILRLLHKTLQEELASAPIDRCAYYVNDGSQDNTLSILQQLHEEHPDQIVIVQLSRNWGHQPALTAGLSVAKGDAVVILDADLQDPPSIIPEMVEKWRAGAKVVEAVRLSRAETGSRGFLLRRFYTLFNWLTDAQFSMNAGVFALMDRQVVDVLLKMPERNRYFPGLRSWVGFDVAQVPYHREKRVSGSPKQTLSRLITYGLDAVFSFSLKPLRVWTFFGLSISAISMISAFVVVFMRLTSSGMFRDDVVLGFTSLFSIIVFLSGIQLASLGILGEYIGRVYEEVKARPYFIIERVWSKDADETDD